MATTPVSVPDAPVPLCEWIEPGLREIAGQDPLGLQTITTDRILPGLLPGVLALSRRARYLSIYAFLLRRYAQSAGQADNHALDGFLRQREFELCVAFNLCPRCEAESAIGNRRAQPLVAGQPASFPRELSVKTELGGYGLYYRSPMEELGLVIPAGRGTVDGLATPIDLLSPSDRAQRLADAFEGAVRPTQWYREWMHGVDPLPVAVLRELAEVACLCRLDEHPEERARIADALLTAPSPERAEATEQRRRAFALLLDRMTETPAVARSDSAFREAVIETFLADPRASDARGHAQAQWAAVAMRECMQEAIASVWHHFCRAGLRALYEDGHGFKSR